MSFLFTDTAPPAIYTLSLHDALPIFPPGAVPHRTRLVRAGAADRHRAGQETDRQAEEDPARHGAAEHRPLQGQAVLDRKSTCLNSSHANISYAVFCLKKKINKDKNQV